MPADVRKAFGLPVRLFFSILGYAQFVGAEPNFIVDRNGSAERFRTSGGRAGANSFLGEAAAPARPMKSRSRPARVQPARTPPLHFFCAPVPRCLSIRPATIRKAPPNTK